MPDKICLAQQKIFIIDEYGVHGNELVVALSTWPLWPSGWRYCQLRNGGSIPTHVFLTFDCPFDLFEHFNPSIFPLLYFYAFVKILGRLVNSVNPDQTAPSGIVWPGYELFGYAMLVRKVGVQHYGIITVCRNHYTLPLPSFFFFLSTKKENKQKNLIQCTVNVLNLCTPKFLTKWNIQTDWRSSLMWVYTVCHSTKETTA